MTKISASYTNFVLCYIGNAWNVRNCVLCYINVIEDEFHFILQS